MPESLNIPGVEIPPDLQGTVAITTLDRVYNWSRRNSMWPMMFGLACCAIEMICAAASRYDLSRFGMEVMRPSPRQADLMLGFRNGNQEDGSPNCSAVQPDRRTAIRDCNGRLRLRRRSIQRRLLCGPGVDKFIPVDVYIPGCPPTPQALLNGLISASEKAGYPNIEERQLVLERTIQSVSYSGTWSGLDGCW